MEYGSGQAACGNERVKFVSGHVEYGLGTNKNGKKQRAFYEDPLLFCLELSLEHFLELYSALSKTMAGIFLSMYSSG